MMTDWKEYKLGQVCSKIGSGATPRGGGDTYNDSGEFALIRSQNILDFEFSNQGLAYINDEQASKLNNVDVEERDILLNITGDSVARVCQVPLSVLPARVNQHVAIIRPRKDILNPEFVKYYLLNPKFKDYMLMLSSSGATRNAITKVMIEAFSIQAPSLSTQAAIASILSSLDDKIELNNQINQDLEALAQALFKHWFIDFEFSISATQAATMGKPNLEGKPYKSSGGEMVESELGEIPKGWNISTFSQHVEVSRGLSYKGSGLTDSEGGFPMVNLNSVYEGGGYKFEGLKYYSGEFKERHSINPWDLAVTNTEQGHKYLLIGYPAFIPKQIGEHAIFSHHIYRVRPKTDSKLSNQFFYYLMLQPAIREQIISACNGTTVNMLKIDGLERPKFIEPQAALIKSFTDTASSIWENKENIYSESQALINLRDTLLPKLISGELELSTSKKVM